MSQGGHAGFATLDDAVRASFPSQQVHLLAVRAHADAAYALFDTRPSGPPYLYGVNYILNDGRWEESMSSNGPGWSRVGDEPYGTFTLWDDAPAGADQVRATYRGELFEEPVLSGIFLFTWWRQPEMDEMDDAWPTAVSFRIDGAWVRRALVR